MHADGDSAGAPSPPVMPDVGQRKKLKRINQKEEEMNTMKQTIMITVLLSLLGVSTSFAESGIPNMVGTWTLKAEGGVLLKDSTSVPKTHLSGEFSTLTAEIVVTKQQGRVFYGTFKSPKGAENFIGVIGLDNKSIYYVDEDGSLEGKIVNNNKIEMIYREIGTSHAVISVGTMIRRK
jgi:hypothetical protein